MGCGVHLHALRTSWERMVFQRVAASRGAVAFREEEKGISMVRG